MCDDNFVFIPNPVLNIVQKFQTIKKKHMEDMLLIQR